MGANASFTYDQEKNEVMAFSRKQQYLPFTETLELYRHITNQIKNECFLFIPIFFFGKFTNWTDINNYVGITKMGATPCGEGIVVKSSNNKIDSKPKYIKIVSKQFSEVHKSHHKQFDPNKSLQYEKEIEKTMTIVTKRRVNKVVEKLIDEGVIPVDWSEKDLRELSKKCPKLVYSDCIKEEKETVETIENFGKLCAKVTMEHLKTILEERL